MFTNLKALAIPDGDVVKIEVNGAVVWELSSSYTNQMPISIDTNGKVYNGVGWKGRYRLSASGGSEKSADYCGITGFIPVKSGAVVRFKDITGNLRWNETNASATYCNIVYYDVSFNYIGGITQSAIAYGQCVVTDVPTGSLADGDLVSFTVPANNSIAYVRISTSVVDIEGNGMKDIIVTVNEEITE